MGQVENQYLDEVRKCFQNRGGSACHGLKEMELWQERRKKGTLDF